MQLGTTDVRGAIMDASLGQVQVGAAGALVAITMEEARVNQKVCI